MNEALLKIAPKLKDGDLVIATLKIPSTGALNDVKGVIFDYRGDIYLFHDDDRYSGSMPPNGLKASGYHYSWHLATSNNQLWVFSIKIIGKPSPFRAGDWLKPKEPTNTAIRIISIENELVLGWQFCPIDKIGNYSLDKLEEKFQKYFENYGAVSISFKSTKYLAKNWELVTDKPTEKARKVELSWEEIAKKFGIKEDELRIVKKKK
jgi:hypothetical protein